jgi:hypothetical protein
MDPNQSRALQFLESVHERLAAFARDSYAALGRGAVVVQAPDIPPGVTAIASTAMVYHAIDEIRNLARADAAVVIRMIETYDPSSQAVVMVATPLGNSITVKMRLDAPVILDDAKGLH